MLALWVRLTAAQGERFAGNSGGNPSSQTSHARCLQHCSTHACRLEGHSDRRSRRHIETAVWGRFCLPRRSYTLPAQCRQHAHRIEAGARSLTGWPAAQPEPSELAVLFCTRSRFYEIQVMGWRIWIAAHEPSPHGHRSRFQPAQLQLLARWIWSSSAHCGRYFEIVCQNILLAQPGLSPNRRLTLLPL